MRGSFDPWSGPVEREKISVQERDRSLDRISYHTDLGQLSERDLIIEAVVEKLDVKNELFGELDALCPDRTILASNTSSLSITDMAAAVGRTEQIG